MMEGDSWSILGAENDPYATREELRSRAHRLQRRVRRLEKLLGEITQRNHHWCHDTQRGPKGCACGKTQWDIKIKEVLEGKDIG